MTSERPPCRGAGQTVRIVKPSIADCADHVTGAALRVAPCTIREAQAFVRAVHRHLPTPPPGGRFALASIDEHDKVRAVALVGFGARLATDRYTATVTRVASDGAPNACSQLYGRCARVWRTMGGKALYTYTLDHESGTSLRAAGWVEDGKTAGGTWDRPSRHRETPQQGGPKIR